MKSLLLVIGLLLSAALCAHAQATSGSNTPQAPAAPDAPVAPTRPVAIVQSAGSPAPQVVTVIHRLSGMKVLSMLRREGQSPMEVDEEFLTTREMMTSVIAGFTLGDGKSVVARLPQADAEFQFSFNWPTQADKPALLPQRATTATPAVPPVAAPNAFPALPRLPELLVIQRDGKPRVAKYIGLDVATGLSLIQIDGLNTASLRDAAEDRLDTGQRVRLLAPQRINSSSSAPSASTSSKMYLAVGEIEGSIKELKRSASGKLAHLIIRAPKLTSAFAGGIVLNEAGETIGIVEFSRTDEASVMPMAIVRRAAERVLARRGNVPQPWLGVHGQAIATAPLMQLVQRGWSQEEAAQLQAQRNGILLTAVVPNTPAALANLRSGDVIVKLGETEVKTLDDFSFMLKEAGSGATVNFTVLRTDQSEPMQTDAAPAPAPSKFKPFGQFKPFVVPVKLSESWRTKSRDTHTSDPLSAAGVESIPLSSRAAARLGANGGLLVVYVNRDSAAAHAGLRVFDIIESINGKILSPSNMTSLFNSTNAQPRTFVIVRDGKKLNIAFSTQETAKP
jgi:S1-C subfamily serine protease